VINQRLGRHAATREGLADDLCHRTFLALFEREQHRLRQWTGTCSLATWVMLIASSVAMDAIRRLGRTVPVDPSDLNDRLAKHARTGNHEPEALERLVRAETIREVQRALGQLSTSDRELLGELVSRGVPARSVAARLGVSTRAVYTRKTGALARLRRALDRASQRGFIASEASPASRLEGPNRAGRTASPYRANAPGRT